MKKNLAPAIASESWGKKLTEENIKNARRNCYKLPKKQIVKKILSFMAHNHVTEADRKVFNKILGDTKILNKLQICTDGSWLNGRIFYKNFFRGSKSNIHVDGEYWMDYYRKNSVSPDVLKKLNYMKYNFEVIFLHLVTDKEALWDKAWYEEMDRLFPSSY